MSRRDTILLSLYAASVMVALFVCVVLDKMEARKCGNEPDWDGDAFGLALCSLLWPAVLLVFAVYAFYSHASERVCDVIEQRTEKGDTTHNTLLRAAENDQ